MSRLARWFGGRRGQASEAPEPIGSLKDPGVEAEAERRRLLLRFESLGENCEVGFLQEHLGVNPLGLFRWSGISLDNLVLALDTDLAGIGEPEFTEVGRNPANGEYFVSDARYGMSTHTHMFDPEHTAEAVQALFAVRGRRLREKLLDDLHEARKIFVFQTYQVVDDAELARLHRALRRLGPAAELLYVRPAAGETPGAAIRAAPGLMRGYTDRPGFDGTTWAPSYDVWLEIMRNAEALAAAPD